MSITLGDYYVETKKTVGDLQLGADDILAESQCEETVNLATIQPVVKKIHEYTFNESAILNAFTGLYEIDKFFDFPDDLFADGYDYELIIDNISFSGLSPLTIVNNKITYTLGGNNWWHFVTNGLKIIMNENNCAGSYANTARAWLLLVTSSSPFGVTMQISINQIIPSTISIDLCGGGQKINRTQLKEISELIEIVTEEGETIQVNSKKRKTAYDPAEVGFGELDKMPKTCNGYAVYYEGSLFSSPYLAPLDKTYVLDSGVYAIKINIPKIPPQILDFKLFDGTSYDFTATSDINGLVDWTNYTPSTPSLNMSLEIWDGAIQELSSGEQYLYLRYDLATYECPCTECSDCGKINIVFYQNCGTSYSLKFDLMVQDGKYNIEGDTYTQGNEIIRPITKIKATYDLVINEYSDETFLLLQELISDNNYIGIIDNIDVSDPETFYYIDAELLSPDWYFNSKLGNIVIPIVKANSIKTKRRNCCN